MVKQKFKYFIDIYFTRIKKNAIKLKLDKN